MLNGSCILLLRFFGFIPNYRKIVLILFLITDVVDLFTECGFKKWLWSSLFGEKKIEQNKDYRDYTKNQEE